MAKLSRTKGANFERQIAAKLREIFPGAKRGYQARGAAQDGCDVEGTPYWCEAKTGKAPRLWPAWQQACAESDGRAPIVVAHRDQAVVGEGGQTIVIMDLDQWLGLLERAGKWQRVIDGFEGEGGPWDA